MRMEQIVEVCDCGCGLQTANGSNFISSHDTKLQGKLKEELQTAWDMRDQRAYKLAVLESALRDWIGSGPSTWGYGRAELEEAGGVAEFLLDRVRTRMDSTL